MVVTCDTLDALLIPAESDMVEALEEAKVFKPLFEAVGVLIAVLSLVTR